MEWVGDGSNDDDDGDGGGVDLSPITFYEATLSPAPTTTFGGESDDAVRRHFGSSSSALKRKVPHYHLHKQI